MLSYRVPTMPARDAMQKQTTTVCIKRRRNKTKRLANNQSINRVCHEEEVYKPPPKPESHVQRTIAAPKMTTKAPNIDAFATANPAGAAPPAGGASAALVVEDEGDPDAALRVGVTEEDPDAREEVIVVKLAPDE